jgi:hypothetical protein
MTLQIETIHQITPIAKDCSGVELFPALAI